MIQVRFGATRVVILKGSYAYKFARIRPIKVVLKILAVCVTKKHRHGLFKKYDKKLTRALWKYLFAGWYANQSEYAYWQYNKAQYCAPIESLTFGGLILKQQRAEPASLDEVSQSLISHFRNDPELSNIRQFGLLDGRCVLVDYAHFHMWNARRSV